MCITCDTYVCEKKGCKNSGSYISNKPFILCTECKNHRCYTCFEPTGDLKDGRLCYCVSVETTTSVCRICEVVVCDHCFYFYAQHPGKCEKHQTLFDIVKNSSHK